MQRPLQLFWPNRFLTAGKDTKQYEVESHIGHLVKAYGVGVAHKPLLKAHFGPGQLSVEVAGGYCSKLTPGCLTEMLAVRQKAIVKS